MITAYVLVSVALLAFSVLIIERMKQIIRRYEALLRMHGIPHSRQANGPKGFYDP